MQSLVGFFPCLRLQFCKAFAAINRASFRRLKRDFTRFPACGADGVIHHPGWLLTFPALLPASGAALRLVCKTLRGVKLLLAGCPDKFLSTFLANQHFVFIHNVSSQFTCFAPGWSSADTFVNSLTMLKNTDSLHVPFAALLSSQAALETEPYWKFPNPLTRQERRARCRIGIG